MTQAAGVSFAMSLEVQGKYQRKPALPFVPGTEIAGIVAAVGARVMRFHPGDRVCAALDWIGLAEQAAAKAVNIFAIPDSLVFARAISFTNSYTTSAAALTWLHLLNVQPRNRLLDHGASSGVGIAAVEIGKICGAIVIATAGSLQKLAVARAHAADHAINYRADGFHAAVLDLTAERGVDAVFDPVGGDVFMQSLRCLAPEGRITPVGFAGGEIPQIPANLLLAKNITVCGLNMGYCYGWSPRDMRHEFEDRMRANMQQLLDWFEDGRIDPVGTGTYALEDYLAAMDNVLARRAIGWVAVVMDAEG